MNRLLGFITVGLLVWLIMSSLALAQNDVFAFKDNFEKNDNQTVLVGPIDSLTFNCGNVKFQLGAGELTVFDFGWDKPSALYFNGPARFIYNPPKETDTVLLRKFTDQDSLDFEINNLFIFYTLPFALPDTARFSRVDLDKSLWRQFGDVRRDAFGYVDVFLAGKLLADLTSSEDGTFLYADFHHQEFDHYIYVENALAGDTHHLFKLKRVNGRKSYDILAAYNLDYDNLAGPRPETIHVDHYDITANVNSMADMTVKIRLDYTVLASGRRFLEFDWSAANKLLSATDSNGDSLLQVVRDEPFRLWTDYLQQSGFAVVLNDSTVAGTKSYIDISYEAGNVYNAVHRYLLQSGGWYPQPPSRGFATYDVTFTYPVDIPIIAAGNCIDRKTEGENEIATWKISSPSGEFSFAAGGYGSIDISDTGLVPVKVYFVHEDMAKEVAADAANSLLFLSKTLGPSPIDTVKIAETVTESAVNSSGLIFLPGNYFTTDLSPELRQRGVVEEISKQWWFHKAGLYADYDFWIVDGLAGYCGLYFNELASSDPEAQRKSLADLRRDISAYGNAKGNKNVYIFHMIRYLLHDYKTGSDQEFLDLLRELAYSSSLTENNLQNALEKRLGDMSWFFQQWVHSDAIPHCTFTYDVAAAPDGKFKLTCHIDRSKVPSAFRMTVPVKVYYDEKRFSVIPLTIYRNHQDVELPPLPLKPERVEFNAYGAVLCIN